MVLQSRRTFSLSSFLPSTTTVSLTSISPARLPPTYRRLLPLLLLAFPLAWYLSLSPSALIDYRPPAGEDQSIPLSALVSLAESDLRTRQGDFLRQDAEERRAGLDLGFDIAREEVSLQSYRSSIYKTLKDVFGWDERSAVVSTSVSSLANSSSDGLLFFLPLSTPSPALKDDYWIRETISYLSLDLNTSSNLPSSPALELFTTASSSSLSSQFTSWKTRHPSWTLRFLDLPTIDAWVEKTFSALLKDQWRQMQASPRKRRERRLLEAVRSDLWKYLVVLQRAGMTVYSDTDSASVRPFDEWGKIDVSDESPPLLTLLPSLSGLSPSSSSSSPNSVPPPLLIVAIEYDSTKGTDGWDRGTFARGIQIAQWTFAGSPGHPVFVDAVGRGLKASQAYHALLRKNPGTELSDDVGRDWAGPGIFSDCVFRYLLARYGVSPRQIGNHAGPVRVGDVLILPERAFQADVSEQTSTSQDAVWHGFLPRWTASELYHDDEDIEEAAS